MSKEKQIEKKECKKCLHYEMCLDNFRKAKREGLWELTEEEEYFSHADECDFCAVGYRKQSEGEWIFHKDGSATCNQCNTTQKHIWDMESYQSYCGHCGAKMKGGAE